MLPAVRSNDARRSTVSAPEAVPAASVAATGNTRNVSRSFHVGVNATSVTPTPAPGSTRSAMVTVTTTPSVASSMQHRGALFDSRLPMPHTTHIAPTFEIGCTTCA